MSLSSPLPLAYIELAQHLADVAGKIIRPYYRNFSPIENKLDQSPVTIADKAVEHALRDLLQKHCPHDSIWGEEFGLTAGEGKFLWTLDPIDGTTSFIIGRPSFATLIGIWYDDKPVLGIIDQPIIGERWLGITGQGTWFNGEACTCLPSPDLASAILSTTGPNYFSPPQWQSFSALSQHCRFTVYGGDAYQYGLLAKGYTQLTVEAGLKLHDFSALAPIILAAGGAFTDWQGQPITRRSQGNIIAAASPDLLARAVQILNYPQ
jgi:inositol-phosphate phosphatase / L-galactose 1-phosphate phosphatase / histidinol-phosphatase